MIRWLPTLSLLLSTLALAGPFGCPVSHVDMCEEQVRIICEFQFRCCDAEERLTGMFASYPYVANESECVERMAGYCKASAGANDDAVAAGRLRFDGDQAKECLAALTAARAGCDYQALNEANSSLGDERGPCTEVSVGLVPDGDACTNDSECADEGGICEIDYDAPDFNEELGTRDGECVGPGGVGDDCTERDCEEDLECVYDAETADYRCAELPGAGEPCPDAVCQEGLACGYDAAAAEYRCLTPAGPGEDCSAGGVCIEPLICAYDAVTYEQTCEDPPAVGEPCPSLQCATGAYCDPTEGTPGTCATQLAPGDECDTTIYDQCAGESSYCDSNETPPVCVDIGAPDPVDDDYCDGN